MTNKRFFSCQLCILFLMFLLLPCKVFALDSCNPLSEYVAEGQDFLLKEAFTTIRNIFSSIAEGTWAAFSPALQAVIAIGIAIYIAMYTLKNLGAFSNQDTAAYLTSSKGGVFPILLKGTFIILLLRNESFVYEYLVSPIISVGAQFGGRGDSLSSSGNIRSLFTFVIQQAEEFNEKAYQIVAMGRLLLCAVILPEGIIDWFWSLIPFGATLFVFGWLIIIGVSFYMLDLIFRLGVGCIVLPLAIACGISKLTSRYTKQTWALFINAAFSFVLLNIILDFAVKMIEESLLSLAKDALEATITGGLYALLDAGPVTEASVNYLVEQLTLKGFILMSLSCLIAFKLCMDTEGIVKKISGTQAIGSAAQKLGGEATENAKNIVKTPFRSLKDFAGATTEEAGKSIGNAIGRTAAARSIRHSWRSTRSWVKRNVFRLRN